MLEQTEQEVIQQKLLLASSSVKDTLEHNTVIDLPKHFCTQYEGIQTP